MITVAERSGNAALCLCFSNKNKKRARRSFEKDI
jgi:hypothetical protein